MTRKRLLHFVAFVVTLSAFGVFFNFHENVPASAAYIIGMLLVGVFGKYNHCPICEANKKIH
jgi:hypothetical protein